LSLLSGLRSDCRSASEHIADSIFRARIEDRKGVRWRVLAGTGAARGRRTVERRECGGSLYAGASGIAVFLIEYATVTGRSDLIDTAVAAARWSLNQLESQPSGCSFLTGPLGVAYLLSLIRHRTGSRALATECAELLEAACVSKHAHCESDVVSGHAGSIIGLLAIHQLTGDGALLDRAIEIGRRLIGDATVRSGGWSWRSRSVGHHHDLLGYAHGASGIGLALAELYRATGMQSFQLAARAAFAYEDSHFSTHLSNWPDFRSSTWSEAFSTADGVEQAIVRYRVDGRRVHEPSRYMLAWCHGAPGIALARLRAAAIFADGSLLRTAEAGVAATLQCVESRNADEDWSICHGTAGLLLVLNNWLGFTKTGVDCTSAISLVESALRRFGTNPGHWPNGVHVAEVEPSLYLGSAGIGLALLRLVGEDVVDPLLMGVGSSEVSSLCSGDDDGSFLHTQLRSGFSAVASLLSIDERGELVGLMQGDITQYTTVHEQVLERVTNICSRDQTGVLTTALSADRAIMRLRDDNRSLIDGLLCSLVNEAQRSLGAHERVRLAPGVEVFCGNHDNQHIGEMVLRSDRVEGAFAFAVVPDSRRQEALVLRGLSLATVLCVLQGQQGAGEAASGVSLKQLTAQVQSQVDLGAIPDVDERIAGVASDLVRRGLLSVVDRRV
jgi:hypothetical protein